MELEVLIFMLSTNCPLDFDPEFWSGFDVAIFEEWNITATTSCYEITEFPSTLYEYKSLANKILMEMDANTVGQANDFTTYINRLLSQSVLDAQEQQVVFLTERSEQVFQSHLARGIAYPTENLAFVHNNFGYSTGTLSHELLHLVLEEQGQGKDCYVDKVHENQFRYALKEIGENMRPVIKKFDCQEV